MQTNRIFRSKKKKLFTHKSMEFYSINLDVDNEKVYDCCCCCCFFSFVSVNDKKDVFLLQRSSEMWFVKCMNRIVKLLSDVVSHITLWPGLRKGTYIAAPHTCAFQSVCMPFRLWCEWFALSLALSFLGSIFIWASPLLLLYKLYNI